MPVKRQVQVKVKNGDFEFLKSVQLALGCNSTQAMSFILKQAKPYLNHKLQGLLSDDSTNN